MFGFAIQGSSPALHKVIDRFVIIILFWFYY